MLLKLLVALGLLTAGVGLAAALPDMRKYLHLRSM
jgi:hypothetical protein